ncbi:aspartate/glutamate racemase family protein [Apibacter sp. HY039]|uniref:aspartate/glutamate racemase family protein n=1 Tax=Apibacter sp. HY039 TaxID=2501476 RepID=UPI000FEBCE7A|nr:amino acid racemase [Apibacter sp. HY039]
MKTIGLIGGMSWESTAEYYKIINQEIKELAGGFHSAQIVLYSVDFDVIEKFQSENKWDEAGNFLCQVAQNLERAGADFIIIATNTMHKVFSQIQKSVSVPLIHIAEPVLAQLKELNLNKLLLLGTKYTMEQTFYKEEYIKNGINIVIPWQEEIDLVNDIIYNELCLGKFLHSSESMLINIINKAVEQENIQGVILGCTELELLLQQDQIQLPLFKTAELHAKYAAKQALIN